MKNRKAQKGYIYLLKSKCGNYFKFGCTRYKYNIKNRVACANRKNQLARFQLVALFKSRDIFKDENELKWNILPHGLGALSEFLDLYEGENIEQNFYNSLTHCQECR